MKGTLLHLASALALCGIAAISATSHALQGEVVLCIGQDGHLEIETAEAGNCVDCLVRDGHQSNPSSVTGPAFADHCGACDDIRLVKCEIQARLGAEFSKIAHMVCLAPQRTATPSWHGGMSLGNGPGPLPHERPATTFLRTIRLII